MNRSSYTAQGRSLRVGRKNRSLRRFFFAAAFVIALLIVSVSCSRNAYAPTPRAATGAVVSVSSASATGTALSGSSVTLIDHLRIPIIMYHYVEPVYNPKDKLLISLTTLPDLFEDQLKVLTGSGYEYYFVRDVPGMFAGSVRPSVKRVVLTFDDGYEDFYTIVFPLLQKYHAKATLYVVNNLVNTQGYVTDDEIRELVKSGIVEIGAHTLDHADLPTLTHEKALRQIVESKNEMEKRYGIVVQTFAYPFGHYTSDVVDIVRKAGFTSAVATTEGKQQLAPNLFVLSRMHPGGLSPSYIIRALQGTDSSASL